MYDLGGSGSGEMGWMGWEGLEWWQRWKGGYGQDASSSTCVLAMVGNVRLTVELGSEYLLVGP